MDPHSPFLVPALVTLRRDLFEINHELLRIVFRVCEEFGRVQREDVVCDSFGGFGEEVAIGAYQSSPAIDSMPLHPPKAFLDVDVDGATQLPSFQIGEKLTHCRYPSGCRTNQLPLLRVRQA